MAPELTRRAFLWRTLFEVYRTSLGESRQNSFTPQKFACSYTYESTSKLIRFSVTVNRYFSLFCYFLIYCHKEIEAQLDQRRTLASVNFHIRNREFCKCVIFLRKTFEKFFCQHFINSAALSPHVTITKLQHLQLTINLTITTVETN